MMMKKIFLSIISLLLLAACDNSKVENKEQKAKEAPSNPTPPAAAVENLLHTPETITFDGTVFELSWSSRPSENYYKQEFIPKDNTIEKYKNMISVELFIADVTVKDAVNQQIQEIEARKPTDRVANYALKSDKEKNETILDFMMSDGKGTATIMEWNVYRYTHFTDSKGRKGIALFSLSKRGYGIEVAEFGPDIRDNRSKYMTDFLALAIPKMSIE